MRTKGREDANIPTIDEIDAFEDEFLTKKKGKDKDGPRWYQLIDYEKLDIPIVGRPGEKSARVDFYAYGYLPDLALTIKEDSCGRFKNSNDVHRAAHYIGIRVLEQLFPPTGSGGRKRISPALFSLMEDTREESFVKNSIRGQIKLILDDVNSGIHSDEVGWDKITEYIEAMSDPVLKEWASKDAATLFDSKDEHEKSLRRLRNRKYRDKQKELGLKIFESE
jgi:hypothetical protein